MVPSGTSAICLMARPLDPDACPDSEVGQQWIIEVQIRPGYHAFERIIAIFRIRGLPFTQLGYQENDKTALLTVFVEAPAERVEQVVIYIYRVIGVLEVKVQPASQRGPEQ